jgi:hypothetical protein
MIILLASLIVLNLCAIEIEVLFLRIGYKF